MTKRTIELTEAEHTFLLSLMEKVGEASMEVHSRKCQMIMETIPYTKLAHLKNSIKTTVKQLNN